MLINMCVIFILAWKCYAQQSKIPTLLDKHFLPSYNDYFLEEFYKDFNTQYYEIPYSVLFDMADDLEHNLSETDSLIQIIIKEFDKLIYRHNCSLLGFPNKLFSKLPIDKQYKLMWEYGHGKGFGLYYSDTLYEQKCFPNCIIFADPTIEKVDKCSLHFSSEKSKGDEQIILVNGTAYHIAKRKDGTTVLREVGKDLQVQIGNCDG